MIADWSGAKERYPLIDKAMDPDIWLRFFEDNPEQLHWLIRNLYAVLRPTVIEGRRGGPRPRSVGTWNDINDVLSPKYSSDPFPVALKELMGKQSLAAFSVKVPCSKSVLFRLVTSRTQFGIGRGGSNPGIDPAATMERLGALARAGGMKPAYFVEWRALWLQEALTAALLKQPNLSISLMMQLADVAS